MDFQFYEQQDSRVIEQMLSTNLVSPMLLCQRLIPILKRQPEAAIVNIGSTFGSIGHPGFTAYCASKFGLRGFTEALQRELADTRIKVSYLAPRATQTELNSDAVKSLNKALGNNTDTPDQVARELMVILSSNQQQRYMGWPEKFFVRLNGLFPGIVHSALVKKLPIVRQYAEQSSLEG
jgi:short-subunit dehydrogenase